MNNNIDLKGLEQRSFRESEQDGFTEFLMGLILFFMGLFIFQSGFVVFCFLPIIFGRKIINWFRSKFTYPRIGHAELKPDDGKKTAVGIFVFMFVVFLVIIVPLVLFGFADDANYLYRAMPLFVGLMMVGGMTYAYSKSGDIRHRIAAVIAVITAIIFTLLDFGDGKMNLKFYLIVIGVFFIVSGLIRFLIFLKKYPKLSTTEA